MKDASGNLPLDTLSQMDGDDSRTVALSAFDLAPVPLWLEDYSGVKAVLDRCRQEGITAFERHLADHPEIVEEAASAIRLIAVNEKTLKTFGAASFDELQANLSKVFTGDMFQTHMGELVQLWEGEEGFQSQGVNYTLDGCRLDIQVRARILPGHERDWTRVLVSTEDVTEREDALRQLSENEAFSRGLFEHSPVSLWVEDFSAIKELIDEIRDRNVADFRTFLDVHPEFIERCLSEIRVIDVNGHTLEMFGAATKDELFARLPEIFGEETIPNFREQLVDLWEGKLFQKREVVNYNLGGEPINVHMQFSIFPGHEHDWSLVQIALTDITARKKAEAYLEYLGKHDILTKLHNRSFFDDELNRLERRGPRPVTIVLADLNSLKPVNDQLGHAAGDALLRRTGEVLKEAAGKPHHAARIGGDEFVVIMPASSESEGRMMIEEIERLLDINNQFYPGARLSLSLGLATARDGERLEDTVKRADAEMYSYKRAFYASRKSVDTRAAR